MSIRVNLGDRSYDIVVTSDEGSKLGAFARERSQGTIAFAVSDENAKPHAQAAQKALMGAGFRTALVTFPAGEVQKSLKSVLVLYDRLADLKADRKTLVVAIGGGVIG